MIATAFSILLMGTVIIFSFLALRHFRDELRKEKLKDDKKPLTGKTIEKEGLIQHT